ncbi:hypothetical protein [Halorubrum sp. F4]|nr:hypothetical protein [Halorubrum sp. F4]
MDINIDLEFDEGDFNRAIAEAAEKKVQEYLETALLNPQKAAE